MVWCQSDARPSTAAELTIYFAKFGCNSIGDFSVQLSDLRCFSHWLARFPDILLMICLCEIILVETCI